MSLPEVSIVAPDFSALSAVAKGGNEITIVTPYYSAAGLRLLERAVEEAGGLTRINFWCHFELEEWISEAIDPVALLSFCARFRANIEISLAHSKLLHAKVYCSPCVGLVGSANLTSHGFGTGLEILLCVSGNILEVLAHWLCKDLYPQLAPLDLDGLAAFVERHREYVQAQRKKLSKIRRDARSRQATLKSLGGFPDHWAFLDFCAKRGGTGATEVVDRGLGKDQLSGHVKAFYYAVQQFLDAYPNLVRRLSKVDPEEFRLQSSQFVGKWKRFVKSKMLRDILEVDFLAQRIATYLPSYLGGKQTRGGAGIGNLNRILPLVASFRGTQ